MWVLLNEAALIAKRNDNTKFRKHYEDFCKALKRYSREIERSNGNNIFLKDGEIQRIGRGSRGRGKPKL